MCPINTVLIILAQKSDSCFKKASYSIAHGLAPYFHDLVYNSVLQCDNIVACFDESLNEIVQKGQMDLCVRYWDVNKSQLDTLILHFWDMPLLTISSQVSLVY